ALAGIVNGNGAWIGDLVSNLSTGMVVDLLNSLDPSWTARLMTDLNNPTSLGVIAGIMNDPATVAFINALLPQLDASALAGIVNGNGAW
ncbi:MAG: hypothetical protein QME84_10705, partial [Actinomycetota bacterium]|nr:hypothetical protein [Actinomycetota bacterium]